MWNLSSTILIVFLVCFLPVPSFGEGTSAEEYFLQGRQLVKDNVGDGGEQKGLEEGIDALKKALETGYPNVIELYKLLGKAYLVMFHYDKSYLKKGQEIYEILLKIAPDDPDVLDDYAGWYLEDNKARRIEFYRRIIKIDPKRADARYVLGLLLIETGSVDEGIKSVVEGIEMESNFRASGNYVKRLISKLSFIGCPLSGSDVIRKKVFSMREAFEIGGEGGQQAIVDMANFKKDLVKKFANHKCPAKKK
jgi:tetratricopeptide (TPR) repeat protein